MAPNEVRARFTEPVRQPQQDAPGDWRVTVGGAQVQVVAVRGPVEGDCVGRYGPDEDAPAGPTGCTRGLLLAAPVDEDATPTVDYVLFDDRVPTRTAHVDAAGSRLLYDGTATRIAADGIRPPTPRIEQVAGRPLAGGRVDAAQAAPVVRVSGLRPGHSAFVRLTPPGGQPTDTDAVTADGDTIDVPLPDLGVDGDHAVHLVARDPSGNLSTDSTAAARADRSPSTVVYGLDRRVPGITSATVQDDTVVLRFTEPVTGPDEPGHFRIEHDGRGYDVTGVRGAGDVRVLDAAGVPAGALLGYQPAKGRAYVDRAGNVVRGRQVLVDGVPLPLVLSPDGQQFTSADEAGVEVASRPGLRLEVFRATGDGDREQVTPRSDTVVASSGRLTLRLPLVDGANDLSVVAVDDRTGDRSRPATVPRIVRDGAAPEVRLLSPAAGAVLAGGSEIGVRLSACDAHPAADGLQVLFAANRRTFHPLATVPLGTSCEERTVRVTLPDSDAGSAALRLVATDLAANTGQDSVAPLVVDAVAPTFAAVTLTTTSVRVTFSEPVSGPLRAADWVVGTARASLVDGVPARQAENVRAFVLSLADSQAFGPNEQPVVTYAPVFAGAPGPAGDELADRARQRVDDGARSAAAVDGIVPAAPVVTSPSGLTHQPAGEQSYAGTAEPGTTLRLVAGDGQSAVVPAAVAEDGRWSATARLAPDRTTVLHAVARDTGGNTSSATRSPDVVQDSVAPSVSIQTPRRGQQLALDSDVEVRWEATDINLAGDAVVVDVTTDGGQTWRVLGEDQPGSGSLTWRTPSQPTSRAGVRVRALDLAGRTGTATQGFLGVGTAADGGTFAPPDEPLQPVPAGRGLDDAAKASPLARVLGALPRTGMELLYLVFAGLVTALVGAGIVVAARDARRFGG